MWRALFSLLMFSTVVHGAEGQHAPEAFAVSIDRQPLDGALQQLARQAGVQLIFFSRVTEGLNAPAIQGDYTLAAAMARMLAGSGLTFRVINAQTVEVRPLQARTIDRSRSREVPTGKAQKSLKHEAAATPLEEVVVVGLAEQLVATRIATPLREIPQTISIVTREQMRQRNEFTLADVLKHAPGITMARNTSLDQNFYARAHQITSFHIDGGAAIDPKLDPGRVVAGMYLGTPDLVEFDHVEILRGADALFSGNANPGGTISLVRKRPLRNFALEVSTAAGSWGDRRVEMDITGPIARDGALRGRVTGVSARDGFFYDIGAHQKEKIFAALEYDFIDQATLTVGASYQWDEAPGVAYGVPRYADGRDSRLPRDTAFEFDWTHYRSELGGAYLQYRQQWASAWALKLNASGWRTEAEYADGSFGGSIDPVTGEWNSQREASFTVSPHTHTQKTADLTLSGTLDWFGWREEVAIGADFTRLEFRGDNDIGYFGYGEPLRDPRAFDPHDYPDPRLAGPPDVSYNMSATTDQYGMFASVRIYFNEVWSIVGGARIGSDSTDVQFTALYNLVEQTLPLTFGSDHVVTPYAGVMYALDRHYSLYVSYADIYLSQTRPWQRASGELLEPIRGVNVEAGIKAEWRNGALNGSLAVYEIEQSNLAIDPAPVPAGFDCCYIGVSSRSRGVDVELSGEVMERWSIGMGYTYNDNESPWRRPLSPVTPKHLLKAWTNVRLPGAFGRWQVGGSLYAQTETTSPYDYCARAFVCIPVESVQPAYAVLDLRAAIDVDRHWRVALSLNNMLDKVYYETIDPRAWYGEPRNWMLRVDARY